MTFDLEGKRIWIAGHTGLVGSALVRRLAIEDCETLTVPHEELELGNMGDVYNWMHRNRPDAIIIAAGRVGGINANKTKPVYFFNDNMAIASNIINAAHAVKTLKLVYLGAPCIYPRLCPQPMREDNLMTGPLEPTNEAYAMAKLAAITLCRSYRQQFGHDFISVIPTNLFGPGDKYDEENSHVIAGLAWRMLRAKKAGTDLTLWGTGNAVREFMSADAAADGIVHMLRHYSSHLPINVAGGTCITMRALADHLAIELEFDGTIQTNPTKPDGMMWKQLSPQRARDWGWSHAPHFEPAIQEFCRWIEKEFDQYGAR